MPAIFIIKILIYDNSYLINRALCNCTIKTACNYVYYVLTILWHCMSFFVFDLHFEKCLWTPKTETLSFDGTEIRQEAFCWTRSISFGFLISKTDPSPITRPVGLPKISKCTQWFISSMLQILTVQNSSPLGNYLRLKTLSAANYTDRWFSLRLSNSTGQNGTVFCCCSWWIVSISRVRRRMSKFLEINQIRVGIFCKHNFQFTSWISEWVKNIGNGNQTE